MSLGKDEASKRDLEEMLIEKGENQRQEHAQPLRILLEFKLNKDGEMTTGFGINGRERKWRLCMKTYNVVL